MRIKKKSKTSRNIASTLLSFILLFFMLSVDCVVAQDFNARVCWEYPLISRKTIDGFKIYTGPTSDVKKPMEKAYEDFIFIYNTDIRCKDLTLPGKTYLAMTAFRVAQTPELPHRLVEDDAFLEQDLNAAKGWQEWILPRKVRIYKDQRFWIGWVFKDTDAQTYYKAVPEMDENDSRVFGVSGYSMPLFFGPLDPATWGLNDKRHLNIRMVKVKYSVLENDVTIEKELGNMEQMPKQTNSYLTTAIPLVMPEDSFIESVSVYHSGDTTGQGKGMVGVYLNGVEDVTDDESDFSEELRFTRLSKVPVFYVVPTIEEY